MESITDWLIKEGFKENQNTRVFEKGTVVIGFDLLAGHTLDSFKELAKKRNWLEDATHPMESIWGSGDYGGYAPGIFIMPYNYELDRPRIWHLVRNFWICS